jgi:hypothetical protein
MKLRKLLNLINIIHLIIINTITLSKQGELRKILTAILN